MSEWLVSEKSRLAAVVLAATVGTVLGLLGGKYLLPVFQAGAVFPVFFVLVRRGELGKCVAWMVLWAFLVAVAVVAVTWSAGPDRLEEIVLLGAGYRHEMFQWIQTGIGREGQIQEFLPQHLLHAGVFCLLTALSLGLAGLLMGSVLLNYMAFYVGALLTAGGFSVKLALLAWPPWAALRVVGFVCLATALSAYTAQVVRPTHGSGKTARRLVLVGVLLLVVDVVLKWGLASVWQVELKQAAGF